MNCSENRIPRYFGKTAAILSLGLTMFVCGFTVSAQEEKQVLLHSETTAEAKSTATRPDVPSKLAQTPAPKTTTAGNPVDDYKKSLNDLVALYDAEVQRLEKENAQLKDLYKDGLIARVAVEASDKSLADARAKSEAIRNDIASANKPPLVGDSAVAFGSSDQPWTTGNARVDGLIRYYGNKYGVDSYLIFCLMSQESSFSSNAVSPKGAQGLMQLMPGTAARYGVTNPYDVSQSIMGGTRYLKDLLQLFNGRVDLALAGYNAGEGAVIKYHYTVPPYAETQNYVRLISARYTRRKQPVALTKPAH